MTRTIQQDIKPARPLLENLVKDSHELLFNSSSFLGKVYYSYCIIDSISDLLRHYNTLKEEIDKDSTIPPSEKTGYFMHTLREGINYFTNQFITQYCKDGISLHTTRSLAKDTRKIKQSFENLVDKGDLLFREKYVPFNLKNAFKLAFRVVGIFSAFYKIGKSYLRLDDDVNNDKTMSEKDKEVYMGHAGREGMNYLQKILIERYVK